jgi:hypothetical protein
MYLPNLGYLKVYLPLFDNKNTAANRVRNNRQRPN